VGENKKHYLTEIQNIFRLCKTHWSCSPVSCCRFWTSVPWMRTRRSWATSSSWMLKESE